MTRAKGRQSCVMGRPRQAQHGEVKVTGHDASSRLWQLHPGLPPAPEPPAGILAPSAT